MSLSHGLRQKNYIGRVIHSRCPTYKNLKAVLYRLHIPPGRHVPPLFRVGPEMHGLLSRLLKPLTRAFPCAMCHIVSRPEGLLDMMHNWKSMRFDGTVLHHPTHAVA